MLTIYGHERCHFCKKAKALASEHKLEYTEKDTDNPDNLQELKTKLPNVKTVPQIYLNDRHIGGYDDFANALKINPSQFGV